MNRNAESPDVRIETAATLMDEHATGLHSLLADCKDIVSEDAEEMRVRLRKTKRMLYESNRSGPVNDSPGSSSGRPGSQPYWSSECARFCTDAGENPIPC